MAEVEASRGLARKKSMRNRNPEEDTNDKMFEDKVKERLTIAVVGGGIGGLAAALALTRRGFKVKVFEKDPSFFFRRQGYGLTLQQGSFALTALGLSDAIVAASSWSQSHFIFDSQGQLVSFWGPTWNEKLEKAKDCAGNEEKPDWKKLGGHNLQIPRQDLRKILYEALPEDTVIWGSHIQDIKFVKHDAGEQRARHGTISSDHDSSSSDENCDKDWGGREVEITFKDGMVFRAHGLIGCDGIHSTVRKLILSEPKPLRYLGYIVVLGIFPNKDFPLCQERVFQTSDGHTRMFAMPFNSEKSMWQLSWAMEEVDARQLSSDPKVERSLCRPSDGVLWQALFLEALKRCKSWHFPISEMIQSTAFELVSGYPAYDRPPATPEEICPLAGPSCIAMIAGDAAHCMSPFKGQGANQALLDGVAIAESLHRHLSRGQRGWLKACQGLSSPDPIARNISDEEISDRIALAFRDAERQMMERTRSKVELSYKAVATLHQPAFVTPEFHVQRKALGGAETVKKIARLRRAGVSAYTANVPGQLERMAFGMCSIRREPSTVEDREGDKRENQENSAGMSGSKV